MPHGGKLIIETAVFDFDESFAREHPAITVGRYVMLAVSDNGIGMDEATRSRIFEPFFTTKEIGKGSGLGLATVYGIVKQSGGHVWVYSEPGRGTTFKIYLPSAEHKVGTSPEAQAEALPPRRDGVTILLAEDDVVMRRLTRKMLEAHGYRVLEAEDGKSALGRDQLAGRTDRSDSHRRRHEGNERARARAADDESHTESKVVYMSGYTGELVANQGLDSGIRLLEKPFTRADLLKTLDAALG